MKVEVTRYRKPDGRTTRHWAVLTDGELLAVTLYRKGAEAVARAIDPTETPHHVQDHDPAENAATVRRDAAAGLATGDAR